jgi:hypothetical protein
MKRAPEDIAQFFLPPLAGGSTARSAVREGAADARKCSSGKHGVSPSPMRLRDAKPHAPSRKGRE